jgi:hypothetical protein
MASKWKAGILTATLILSTVSSAYAGPKNGQWEGDGHRRIRHVLLISIDGMHAVDFANCVASDTCPHLAELGETDFPSV